MNPLAGIFRHAWWKQIGCSFSCVVHDKNISHVKEMRWTGRSFFGATVLVLIVYAVCIHARSDAEVVSGQLESRKAVLAQRREELGANLGFSQRGRSRTASESDTILENIQRAWTIYCSGPVREAIQLSGLYPDSKSYVDMPMRVDPEQVLANFNAIDDTSNITQLKQFMSDNFDIAGADLEAWVPTDYQQNPPFLRTIKNASMQEWAAQINSLWLRLGKQVTTDVSANPQRHSFLPRG
jgi:hypothetical protein